MLSFEKTNEYLIKAKAGDMQAKGILIKENENLIKSLVRKFKNKGETYEDLYQIACVGFIKAINNFDLSFGVRFSTYLVPMITGEIKRFLRDDGLIKVSRIIKQQRLLINNYIESFKNENLGESPTIEQVCRALKMEESEVVMALDSAKMPISIYDKQDDDDSGLELIDKIAEQGEEEKMVDRIMLKTMIDELPLRDKKIILLRYFRDKTQTETAKALGVSQVQVSRLENKIIKKLKSKIAN